MVYLKAMGEERVNVPMVKLDDEQILRYVEVQNEAG